MKFTLALFLTFTCLTSFAGTLADDLKNKDCSINFKRTLIIKKKEAMVESGGLSIMSIFHNSNLKLKSGTSYPVRDVSQGTIAINQGSKLIFLCINDGDECLADLTQIHTDEIFKLSERALNIECI